MFYNFSKAKTELYTRREIVIDIDRYISLKKDKFFLKK